MKNKDCNGLTFYKRGTAYVHQINIVGVGSGWGAKDIGTADGTKVLLDQIPPYFQRVPVINSFWHGKQSLCFSNPKPLPLEQAKQHAEHIFEMSQWLSKQVKTCIRQGSKPLILGGDHSIAIGTWSGAKAALQGEDMGLIWIDAHMDAHTFETSPSRNIHGMPLAILLGYGEERLTNLENTYPKLMPENLCLIGTRSFEEGEAALLAQLGVQVYSVKDVQERGCTNVFQEVRHKLSARRFGMSIDVDAFDPTEAPGTGISEPNGLKLQDIKEALQNLAQDPNFIALEIAEFNPHRDINNKTCQLVWQLATLIIGGFNEG